MTGETALPAPAPRFRWSAETITAWAAVVVTCVVLLGVIRYAPSYEEGKYTLFQMWVHTFWDDVSTQIAGIFAGQSKESQSGEATSSEWNYCLLVPFIVAWLVWRQWPRLRELPLAGSGRGGYALLGAGFALYILGFLMESYYVGMGAMEIVYAGLIVLFLGWPALRLLWFPVAFLVFMWPYSFMEDIALELRLVMSAASHYFLEIIDVPNILSGTAILSAPHSDQPFAIDVADPCSGIRSLFALVMIAAVYAFVAFDKLWQQAVIVAMAVPLVMLGNLVRIVILALGTLHFGAAFALGTNAQPSWFHEIAGYLVYFINFGGLIALGSLLTRPGEPPPAAASDDHASD
ncbi:MAG: exosortase/archaeosortase family protein [Verrucomicrobiota bacterium]